MTRDKKRLKVRLKPVLDQTYPLADLPAAISYVETGRARGKVVIEVA